MTSRATIGTLVILFIGCLLSPTVASADATFCLPGSGLGQCNSPQGLAVDTETRRVYVADRGSNNRVNIFESNGTPVGSFAAGLSSPTWVAVDNNPSSASRHSIYATTDSSDFLVKKFKPNGATAEYVEAESFGQEGTGPCQFAPNDPIAVGPNGNVYVANSYEIGPNNFFNRVIVFDSSGNCVEEVPTPPTPLFEGNVAIRNFAVDSGGHIYVTVAGAGGVLRKYSPSGTLLYELDKGTQTEGIAVDGADSVFAKQRAARLADGNVRLDLFTEYSSSGATLRRFGYVVGTILNVPGLAAYSSPDGDLYASEGSLGVKYLTFPPPGPVVLPVPCEVKAGGLGNTNATLLAEVNPEGKATTFHFEYVTEAQFKVSGFSSPEESDEAPLPGAPDFNLHEAAVKVEGLDPETKYHCRALAKNADGEAPAGLEGTFETREGFEFGPAWASNVGETTATVNAEGNPLGIAAKGQVEYVEDAKYQASEFDEALKAPLGEVDYGSGQDMQLRSVLLSGLTPGTVYHWRLRAKNGTPPEGIVCAKGEPSPCPENEHTFRTYRGEAGGFDDRGYELVSPAEKNSAEVAVPGVAGGVFEDQSIRIQAGATSGEAVTYTSWTSFGKAGSAPATSQYLSKRTHTGWATESIPSVGFQADILTPPFTGFAPDLTFGAFKAVHPALAPDCSEGMEGLYLHNNTTGGLQCLTPGEPTEPSREGCSFAYAGSSADGGRAFFVSGASYGDAPLGQGFSLYEWSAAEGLRLVSILPDGSKAIPSLETSYGARGGNCQTGQKVLRHAVSVDGSRAFWSYVPKATKEEEDEGKKPISQLLVRVGGTETVQLDKVQSGGGKPGEGIFWAASADGSVAYFTDENRLISGSKSEEGAPDLYRYELGQAEPLTNLTKGLVPGDVRGVVGASDDGSYVYFVAGAVLSGNETNSAGLEARAGKDNLYLFHEGIVTFIATLAHDIDQSDWESQPKSMSARVSPDGRYLAFLSVESKSLAGYDNTIAGGEHCQYDTLLKKLVGSPLCSQAFLFDANLMELTCASCNPSGSRPTGPTLLPGWTNVYEGPRYLSNDGSRLFFESIDQLLQADENKKRDVYEFERPGMGSCSASSSNFDPASGGCHFLVSGGKSTDEAFLVDASSDGRDAFFSTRQKLVGWDRNDNFDVYDYREGGGFAEPPQPSPPCDNEGCLPAPPPLPPAIGLATPSFTGLGNANPRKPRAKPKHHKKKHKSRKRRAAR